VSERHIPKVCGQCLVAFDGRKAQSFCSRSCAARHTNHIRETTVRPPLEACPQQHPYTEKNTYTSADGRRHCRECKRDRERIAQRKRDKRPPKPTPTTVTAWPTVLRPLWRPRGFVLRPGDQGYEDQVAS